MGLHWKKKNTTFQKIEKETFLVYQAVHMITLVFFLELWWRSSEEIMIWNSLSDIVLVLYFLILFSNSLGVTWIALSFIIFFIGQCKRTLKQ